MRRKAFTLIELLIVVSIIGILSAVALPNFLDAQVRAKIARAKTDMRTMATALEAYAADHTSYPPSEINGTLKWLCRMTTPVAYLSTNHIKDPFTPERWVDVTQIPTLRYYGFNGTGVLNTYRTSGKLFSPRSDGEPARILWFMLFSHGPDSKRNNLKGDGFEGTFVKKTIIQNIHYFVHYVYDPSNGTVSMGELFRAGGSSNGKTADVARFVMSHH